MPTKSKDFIYIDTQKGLSLFYEENKSVNWMCFDTEFVGEKRFVTRLCLIQITTSHGNYLVDPFTVKDLGLFLNLLQNPEIVKVTHAGDNDYRLLNDQFGVIPKNVFDTQVAAGFVGYKHPVSFRRLVENELRIFLKKGYTVTDWETRPFHHKQLQYALDDVLPLHSLWQGLKENLQNRGRLHWAREEFEKWETEDFYAKDPHHEALSSSMIKALNPKEQVFFIRLLAWRRQVAKEKNHSKEMVLPNKLLGQIVRSVQSGRDALKQNRRIPDHIVNRYGQVFDQLFNQEITPEEKSLLAEVNEDENINPRKEILLEMLYLLIKYKCLDNAVSPSLVFPKNMMQKIHNDPALLEGAIKNGWRRELLGDAFIQWLENLDRLELDINGDNIRIVTGY
jgi:ribonuclease D